MLRIVVAKVGLDGHDRGSGVHRTDVPSIIDQLSENDATDVLVLDGGTIPNDDAGS